MTVSFKSLGLAVALAITFAVPVQSQTTAAPDFSEVHSICLSEIATVEECHAAINDHYAVLRAGGFSQEDVDTHLHSLAISLGAASQTGGNPQTVASGLTHVASLISDPVRAASVSQLSAAVSAGSELPVAAIGNATLASPN